MRAVPKRARLELVRDTADGKRRRGMRKALGGKARSRGSGRLVGDGKRPVRHDVGYDNWARGIRQSLGVGSRPEGGGE